MSEPRRTAPDRSVTDRCPGVFSTHAAADGHLARIRLPGGEITPSQLQRLAQAAAELGDGHLELTARANIQLRGIRDVAAVAAVVIDAGLVPSSSHEKVRNIEASPLSGRIGGVADVRPLIGLLDTRLQADDELTALSGRFLFGLDDGRGDIMRRAPDACAVAREVSADGLVADIFLGDLPIGSATGFDDVVAVLLAAARHFVRIADGAWRVVDLSESKRTLLAERTADGCSDVVGGSFADAEPAPIVGWLAQDDGAVLLGSVVALGRIPSRLAEFIAAIGAPIIVTPDREILICDLDEGVAETVVRVLAPMGLIFDAASPWVMVSSCAGAPGCSNGLAPVRADLLARVQSGDPVTEREHWVGCDRGCGSPAVAHTRVEAGPDGYTSS